MTLKRHLREPNLIRLRGSGVKTKLPPHKDNITAYTSVVIFGYEMSEASLTSWRHREDVRIVTGRERAMCATLSGVADIF